MFNPIETIETVGIQSRIEIGDLGLIPAIKKTFGENLTQEQRVEMVVAMDKFRNELERRGINTPKNFETNLTNTSIETVDEFIDLPDLDKQLKNGEGLEGFAHVVLKLVDLDGSIAIDAKPANWVCNDDITFIDFYPPTLNVGGNVEPFIQQAYKRPQELFNFNYIDPRGQITKLLAGARFTYPDRLQDLEDIALACCVGTPYYEYIEEQIANGYPDMNLFYGGDDEKAINRLKQL